MTIRRDAKTLLAPEELQKCGIQNKLQFMHGTGGLTMAEWISVKDRLPKEGEVVVVYIKPKVGVGYAEVDIYLMGDFDEYSEGVTHWMPLPEPPKGE